MVRPLLEMAYRLGWASGVCRRSREDELRLVFPELGADDRSSACRRIEGLRFVRGMTRKLENRGFLTDGSIAALTAVDGRLPESGPLLVVGWHAGLARPLLAALRANGRWGIVLKFEATAPVSGFVVVASGWTVADRARAFAKAIERLKDGQVVVLFLDAQNPARALERPRPMLGRLIGTTLGPAALARLSGAKTVVAESTWVGGSTPFRVRWDRSMAAPEDRRAEESWTDALYAGLERRIASAPGELWPISLSFLAGSPLVKKDPSPTR